MKTKIMKKFVVLAAVVGMLSTSIVANAEESYTVKTGDNLKKIAKQVYGDSAQWESIYEANKATIKNPKLIYAGQVLTIPSGAEQTPAVAEETAPVSTETVAETPAETVTETPAPAPTEVVAETPTPVQEDAAAIVEEPAPETEQENGVSQSGSLSREELEVYVMMKINSMTNEQIAPYDFNGDMAITGDEMTKLVADILAGAV